MSEQFGLVIKAASVMVSFHLFSISMAHLEGTFRDAQVSVMLNYLVYWPGDF